MLQVQHTARGLQEERSAHVLHEAHVSLVPDEPAEPEAAGLGVVSLVAEGWRQQEVSQALECDILRVAHIAEAQIGLMRSSFTWSHLPLPPSQSVAQITV